MKTKSFLEAADVDRILDAAVAEASANSWAVTVAIVDDGGHLLALRRLDGCAPMGALISVEKARSSAIGRRETKGYEDMINNGRTAFLTAPAYGFLEGGVPIVVDGNVVGAVGVSGVKSDQDAQVAKAGIAAL
ncbi:hypothetical protein E8K88_12890 [Lampropedia aestuarii]|uniref:Heme-binding protein n=1 Tax=Lampropedia aestuarii TaxID=2562762 RepID=A0A4V3YWQ8_9BURK|nr:heme-binding protein [Lampropedia aestuarii]MDH5858560.1 heme-binding protein [Lampropedia aestuarii]THJ32142.1 hypothetical protein E8K88_12890 [Lampropedia aestuarii]